MNEHELEQLLQGAFEAEAHRVLPDDVPAPPLTLPPTGRGHRRWLAPLAAAAAVLVAVGLGVGLSKGTSSHPTASAPTTRSTMQAAPTERAVRLGALHADPGATPVRVRVAPIGTAPVGVGLPVVAYFSAIADGRAVQAATTVTVNGRPLAAAWYFERSSAVPGYPVEAHLRPQQFWPAHSTVTVAMRLAGLTAGNGLGFTRDEQVRFRTGAADIATVSDARHQLTLTRDGERVGAFPVSLGASNTPTRRGTKVIMAKESSICVSDPTYSECGVKYAQRLTYSGEYLLAAPWNSGHIGRIDSSNGSTDLRTAAAARLYRLLRVGDVVRYPDASGPPVGPGDGFTDWDVPWQQWRTGGLVRTTG
jgi:lipoprotein-anchoring transpeptidase ErfK/SrfK